MTIITIEKTAQCEPAYVLLPMAYMFDRVEADLIMNSPTTLDQKAVLFKNLLEKHGYMIIIHNQLHLN